MQFVSFNITLIGHEFSLLLMLTDNFLVLKILHVTKFFNHLVIRFWMDKITNIFCILILDDQPTIARVLRLSICLLFKNKASSNLRVRRYRKPFIKTIKRLRGICIYFLNNLFRLSAVVRTKKTTKT